MSSLDILRARFGDTPVLGVEQIAACLNVSRGHIYNLASQARLPFPLLRFSDKVQVSTAVFAKYLDGDLDAPAAASVASPVITKKKMGRPRGANTSKLQLTFQSQLRVAILQHEFEAAMNTLQEGVRAIEYSAEDEDTSRAPGVLKNQFQDLIEAAKFTVNRAVLELGTQAGRSRDKRKPGL